MRKIYFQLFMIIHVFILNVSAQNLETDLKEKSIEIKNIDQLPKEVYKQLSAYSLIMVGEIHGTNEPVKLVEGLIDLFVHNGDSVQVGFEIPSSQMLEFIQLHNDSGLMQSLFFSDPSGDGRASQGWYKVLSKASKNPRVKICFFDANENAIGDSDSLMYLNVKRQMVEHPKWRTLAIGGGNHFMLKEIDKRKSCAYYLVNDEDLNLRKKLCTIEHEFESGTTLWNEFPTSNTMFTRVKYETYLHMYKKEQKSNFSGVYFTRKLTASESAITR